MPAAAALGVRCPPRVSACPEDALTTGVSEPDQVTHLSVLLIVSRFERRLAEATCGQVRLIRQCSVCVLADLLLLRRSSA